MVIMSMPMNDIMDSIVGPEQFEFLGVGATARFVGHRKLQTPLKKTSGSCIVNVLILDRGPQDTHQSSDLATKREVEEAGCRIIADCLLHQNAGGKIILGDNDDMALFVYAVDSKFDRAEKILNIDAYHPQDWERLLDDHILNTAVHRIRTYPMAGQGSSRAEGASTGTTQQCSTGYGKSPDDCCLDYSFNWQSIDAGTAQLVLGTLSSIKNSKFGWCEFVTATMELAIKATKRDLSTTSIPLSKRTIQRPVCENHFGTPSFDECFNALTDVDFLEEIPDNEYDLQTARHQILEFLAPYTQPRFPQFRSAQTPRAWSSGSCEVAVMWRWNGLEPTDLATEQDLSDGGARVVQSCVIWGSGGYQLVGS
ncbi:MAG: hypothetical protein M1812_006444 [Candelaria pacifica]|nr:MAG: hypothetical protein M1812_006444 [Candelaria pacifica]